MEFEDIVDMDWLNSNTTTDESILSSTASPSLVPIKSEPLDSFSTSTDYCHDPALYGFADQSLMWQNDFTTTTTDLEMLDPTSPCSPASSSLPDKQQEQETSQQEKNNTVIGAAQQTETAPQSQPVVAPMPDMVMPSTEHIKQLIEIAKQHLALREQQQQQQGGQKQLKQEKQQIILKREEQSEKEQSQQQEISQQSGDLQRLYNETAPISFFVHPTAISNVPDTVAPESLMKTTSSNKITAPTTTTTTTTTTNINTTTATSSPSTPPSNKEQEENVKASSPPPPTSPSSEYQQNRRASSVSLAGAAADEAMTLEAYAVSDGIDIKKLTPKERRQLRNKISARNFRVRRKEYISTLEAQVDEHKKHAEQLKSRLDNVEDENKQLRLEVDTLRRQNQLLQQQQQQKNVVAGPSSPGSPRVSSPIPKPSLNKDISMLGSKASETYRHDTRILVSNAVMPVWDFDQIFTSQQDKSATSMITTRCSQQQQQFLAPPEQVLQCAGYILTMFVQLHRASEDVSLSSLNNSRIIELEDDGEGEQQQQTNKIDVPLLPDDRDFTSESDAWEKPTAVPPTFASPAYMEYLYDTLIMSALTTNTHTDKSFWWWDTPMFHQ
ncbi:hypothetical protein INT45_002133 [Circinella minor]|uniref:BZIP domain-containing protein n=1 Tax=Circinella minor TaxID=1195481 RepID=A0A8H7SG07_9FUNG|nr:hypothetical protein INT45_002133 [Circinella minor]